MIDKSGENKEFDTHVTEEITEDRTLFDNQKIEIISSASKVHDMLSSKKDMDKESEISYKISVLKEGSQKKVRPSTHNLRNHLKNIENS